MHEMMFQIIEPREVTNDIFASAYFLSVYWFSLKSYYVFFLTSPAGKGFPLNSFSVGVILVTTG